MFSIFLQSFLKLWDEWMHPFHKISINLRLARNNTFCFCEQCLLYLSYFAGDHPLVQPAVQHERIKKSCQSWKYSPPAFIINMHWNWTFVKSLPNAEYLTWLKINMEWTFLFINLTKLIGLPKPLLNCLSKYQNM